MAYITPGTEISYLKWIAMIQKLSLGDTSTPGIDEVRTFIENSEYKLKMWNGSEWKVVNRHFAVPIISSLTSGLAIQFDNGHACISVHDGGSGHFNLKSGVDESHKIVNTNGGSLIKMADSGAITLAISTKPVGSTFTDDIYLKIDQNGVVINGNTVYHAGNLIIETGNAAGSTTGQQNSFLKAFSQAPRVVVTPNQSGSGTPYISAVTTTSFTLVTPTAPKFCNYIAAVLI